MQYRKEGFSQYAGILNVMPEDLRQMEQVWIIRAFTMEMSSLNKIV